MTLVLADTSVWVAHFRRANPLLQSLAAVDQVLCHPLVVLELACGTPPAPRERTIGDLKKLEQAVVATTDETLALIEREQFHDLGCGAIDMALLASVRSTHSGHIALDARQETRCFGGARRCGVQSAPVFAAIFDTFKAPFVDQICMPFRQYFGRHVVAPEVPTAQKTPKTVAIKLHKHLSWNDFPVIFCR